MYSVKCQRINNLGFSIDDWVTLCCIETRKAVNGPDLASRPQFANSVLYLDFGDTFINKYLL